MRSDGPAGFIGRAVAAGKLAGGYVIVGTGADAAAIDAAAILLCRVGKEPGAACGECRDCRLARSLTHPDLYLIHPLPSGRNERSEDGPFDRLSAEHMAAVREEIVLKAADPSHVMRIPGAASIKLSSVRELRRRAAMASAEGGARVALILDADLMTPEGSNALLKTLEEPARGLTIILTTNSPSQLLPTVLSRCQVIRTGAAPEPARDEAAEELAIELLRTFLGRSELEALALIDRLEDDLDRPALSRLLGAVQSWLREAMIAASTGRDAGSDAIRRFVSNYPGLDYAAFNGTIEEAISDLSRNAYIQLVLVNLRIDLRRISAGSSAVGTRLRQ